MPSGLDDPVVSTADALAGASALEEDGRPLEAIELLSEANRGSPDARLEERLVLLRHVAFDSLDRTRPDHLPPVIVAEPHAGPLPELEPIELTAATLRAGMARNGCVLVRGLISPTRAAGLARGIDRVLEGFDAQVAGAAAGSSSPWYAPFEPPVDRYRVGGRRKWVRASGAVWTVESPRMLFELCELLDETGIGDLVTAYLGERPALSANKCTVRRVPVDTSTNWHQDGAFLGAEVRSLNLWLVLSDCGADSPGLEIVPRRLDTVLPTGTDGAIFDWSVSPEIVDEVSRDTPVLAPYFRAGDALLFDHMLLHRTAARPGMTRERYAMENWLFAPSSYPEGQIPLVL
jgi:Phytanoyl-CoA dioxygenase (PhyH)